MPVHPKFREVDEKDAQNARRALRPRSRQIHRLCKRRLDRRRKYSADLSRTCSRRTGCSGDLSRRQERRAATRGRSRSRKTAKFPGQGHRLFRRDRKADAVGERDDLKARRPDDVRSAGLPPADHRRRDHAADAAGSRNRQADQRNAVRAFCSKNASDIVPTIQNLIDGFDDDITRMKAATAGLTMPNSTRADHPRDHRASARENRNSRTARRRPLKVNPDIRQSTCQSFRHFH